MLTEQHMDTVTGYADGVYRVMRELGIDRETLDDLLLSAGVELCENCGWYGESGAMLDEHGYPDGFCDNCRGYDAPREG